MNTILTRTQTASAQPARPPGTVSQGGEPAQPALPGETFQRSADLKRDGFLGATLLGTCTLPYAGTAIGLVGGPLAALAGLGEVREGMRSGSTREVLNGAAHLAVGGIITVCACINHPLANAFLLSVGVGTLAVKSMIDHPAQLPQFVLQEASKLAKDGMAGVADLMSFKKNNTDNNKPA